MTGAARCRRGCRRFTLQAGAGFAILMEPRERHGNRLSSALTGGEGGGGEDCILKRKKVEEKEDTHVHTHARARAHARGRAHGHETLYLNMNDEKEHI